MKRKLPRLIILLVLGSAGASIVGSLITAAGVAVAFGQVDQADVNERAHVLASGISRSMNLGAVVGALLLPLGWWWAARQWQREE